MNKLPNVYANPIDKKINNVQENYYSLRSSNIIKKNSEREINRKIDQIFASSSHISKSRVLITLEGGVKEVDIIGKSNNNILTMDGSLIKISDILDVEKK